MVYKALGLLLCIGVMSLVSGCYCYPPGYYHHPHRHSSVSPYRSYIHPTGGAMIADRLLAGRGLQATPVREAHR
jgi:hypothetical protein